MADYFVDFTGGLDANAGTSSGAAWKTIAKVHNSAYSPGDLIQFKKGEQWREGLVFPSSGSSGNPITISSYGSGAAPIINAANLITPGSSWTLSSGNIWTAAVTTQPSIVAFDGVRGFKVASQALCNSTGKWFWAANVLSIYSTSDPDTAFVAPGIEAGTRGYCFMSDGQDYLTVTGLHCKFANSAGIEVNSGSTNCIVTGNTVYGTNKGILSTGQVANIEVLNNIVTDTWESGIWTYNSGSYSVNGITIRGNTVTGSGHYGIDVAFTSTNPVLIESNTVDGCGLTAAVKSCIGILNTQGSVIARYNLCKNGTNFGGTLDGNGFMLDTDAHDIECYYNVCHTNQGGGVNMWELLRTKVYNNVLYNNGNSGSTVYRGGIVVGGINGGNTLIKNNICLNNVQAIKVDNQATTTLMESDHNILYPDGAAAFHWKGTDYNFAGYKAASGLDANSINADPLFVNAAAGDFHLLINSPGINAGVDVDLIQDFFGNLVGATPDIGAHEFAAVTASPVQF